MNLMIKFEGFIVLFFSWDSVGCESGISASGDTNESSPLPMPHLSFDPANVIMVAHHHPHHHQSGGGATSPHRYSAFTPVFQQPQIVAKLAPGPIQSCSLEALKGGSHIDYESNKRGRCGSLGEKRKHSVEAPFSESPDFCRTPTTADLDFSTLLTESASPCPTAVDQEVACAFSFPVKFAPLNPPSAPAAAATTPAVAAVTPAPQAPVPPAVDEKLVVTFATAALNQSQEFQQRVSAASLQQEFIGKSMIGSVMGSVMMARGSPRKRTRASDSLSNEFGPDAGTEGCDQRPRLNFDKMREVRFY